MLLKCKLCGGTNLVPALSLESQALMELTNEPSVGQLFPLDIVFCGDCHLPQLSYSVPQAGMYDNYWYRSSISETMRAALKDVVEAAEREVPLPARAGRYRYWTDIGANDGCLLRECHRNTFRTAIEPSSVTPAGMFIDSIVKDYFPCQIPSGKQDIITSIAMFYDVPEPVEFAASIAYQLKDDGVWINQLNTVVPVMKNTAYDFISHEHITYWTLETMQHCVEKVGLEVYKVEHFELNGGTSRYYIGHKGKHPITESVMETNFAEMHYNSIESWRWFDAQVQNSRARLHQFIEQHPGEVVGRGASTRGNVILQYCGLGPEQIPYIADRDPRKHGLYMSGSKIPIVSEQEAHDRGANIFLLMLYSYYDQIKKRDSEVFGRDVQYLLPLGGKLV